MSNPQQLLHDYHQAFHQSTVMTDARVAEVSELTAMMLSCGVRGNTVYLVGNGGSAAIASHMSNDAANCLGIRSSAWCDSAMITCLANDNGYEEWVAHAVSRDLVEGDLLIAISSSGRSKNILNGVEKAKTLGGTVATLSGFTPDNPLRTLGTLNIWIDSDNYIIVAGGHQFLIAAAIELGIEQQKQQVEGVVNG